VLLKGPSGSGKTTLLLLLAGLLEPDEGEIHIFGTSLSQLKPSQRDQFRVDTMGFIFQTFNLIPYLSMMENVTLSCSFSKIRRQRALVFGSSLETAVKQLLLSLDLNFEEIKHRPVTRLSIGQQQRVAAARALIGHPNLLIADEPTSALDPENRSNFINVLFEQCRLNNTTLVYVSHDTSFASLFHRVIDIRYLYRTSNKESADASRTTVL
jgi:putative ABC transport system ATP-binding protein